MVARLLDEEEAALERLKPKNVIKPLNSLLD